MPVTATPVPSADDIDIAALRERCRRERDRRLHPDGGRQYLKSESAFSAAYEADPHTPLAERAPIVADPDAVILGGGFSGLMAGVHLRNAGVTGFRHIEHAGDFGGVWYWFEDRERMTIVEVGGRVRRIVARPPLLR